MNLTRQTVNILINQIVFITLFVLPSNANSIQEIRPITPRPVEPLIPDKVPEIPEKPLKVPEPISPNPEIQNISGTVRIRKFKYVGNTVFSEEFLNQQLVNFINKRLSFEQLLQAEAIITKLYTDAGYINSGAVIPAGQVIKNGEVTIQIIEGGIEEIIIQGTERLDPNFIRDRLALSTKKPLNINTLLRGLQVLQLNPLIENLSAELTAGTRPEASILKVTVTEAETFNLAINLDNNRVPSIGTFERGIRLTEDNLFGFGDKLDIAYNNTDGSNSLDASYTFFINPRNGTIRLAGGFTNTDVIEPPFDELDITGDSRYYELTWRQPIIETPSQDFVIGLTVSREESETTLLGEKFPLSLGANDLGETNIAVLRFFQDWVNRNPTNIFALRSQFSLGLGIDDITEKEQPPDDSFFVWRLQGQYVQLLAPDTLWIVRSDIQLANQPLLGLEQISLGGVATVRGYRQDQLLTDNGFLISTEVLIPILRVPEWKGLLQIVPFVDFAVGWNNSNFALDPNTLLGIGLGLRWNVFERLSASFDWGIPLIYVNSTGNTLQESGLYFTINYKLF